MPITAGDVIAEATSVYLNDSAKTRWTDVVLLPYLKSAILELQAELEDNDLPPIREISAVIPVAKNTKELTLPADFVFPIKLEEKYNNEQSWRGMDEVEWEPSEASTETRLKVWVFREGKIKLAGSVADTEVLLKYLRTLSQIADANSVIEVPNAKGFLAARTAGLASSFGGAATARGGEANARAGYFLRKIIQSLTKRLQDRPVRRRGYKWH